MNYVVMLDVTQVENVRRASKDKVEEDGELTICGLGSSADVQMAYDALSVHLRDRRGLRVRLILEIGS